MEASGSDIVFSNSLTIRLSTVFALSRGTKKTNDFTVASLIGPLESVKPFTHSGKIFSLIMTSSKLPIMSPIDDSNLKRTARSGEVKRFTTSGAIFSLKSSLFSLAPIFKIAGKTWAASCPGNFCASSSSLSTCFVCIGFGMCSTKLGSASKKASFSSGDLICKLLRNSITRTDAFSCKHFVASRSAMGLLPRRGCTFCNSAYDFLSSAGISCAAAFMSRLMSTPFRATFGEANTYAASRAAPHKSMATPGAPPEPKAAGGSGHLGMVGPSFRLAPSMAAESASFRQSSKLPSLYSPWRVT
mmetsp:Transcript_11006/g.19941  ORF Transcript_11006/g.19941 Transcript_11006/m.19941 type:complete len:301 (-) Transcript_11006:495-1397(-)